MNSNTIYFLPLGGSSEIGMNLNLYHYNGKWLMVDVGVSFSQNNVSDICMPSLSGWLEKYPNAIQNLSGILITHAHEDHYGAIPHLWPILYEKNKKLKIYTTAFTAELLKHKMKDNCPVDIPINIEIKNIDQDYEVDCFKIKSIYMTHSTMEQMAFVIEFPNGESILHTGDWKIDNDPVVGRITNEEKLKKFQNKILAIVGDSTNSLSERPYKSEESIGEDLLECVKKINAQNKVIITHFASNIARMQSCIDVAEKTGRSLAICGRSMHRFYDIGVKFNYITPKNHTYLIGYRDEDGNLIQSDPIGSETPLLIIATGSQGEEKAFLSRLVNGNVSNLLNIEVGKKTTVIFSSRNIPGNEIAINNLINKLILLGVNVIRDIHVSGHPDKNDLKKLYEIIKPKYIIPVHGYPMHIMAHKSFSEEIGLKSHFTENGQLLAITKNEIKLVEKIPVDKHYLYGQELISSDSKLISQRQALSENGILIIDVHIRSASIFISQSGLFEEKSNTWQKFKNLSTEQIKKLIRNSLSYQNRHKSKMIIKNSVQRIISDMLGRYSRPQMFIKVSGYKKDRN